MKSEKKTLWIVSELFYPEETSTAYILTKIANKLSERYKVEVICGPAVYETEKIHSEYTELNDEVTVHRLSGIRLNKNNLMLRLFRFILLSFQMTLSLWKRIRKGDKVLIVTNPAPLLLMIAGMKSLRSFKLIILVHDVFPENTIPAGIFKSDKSLFFRFLKTIFDKAYSKAELLIVLGRDMENVIEAKIKRFKTRGQVSIIENWGETDEITPLLRENSDLKPLGLENKIVIQYAGNFGRVQGILELLAVIGEIHNPLLHFVFFGGGALKDDMKEIIYRNNLKNVTIGGCYSRAEQMKVLNTCDLAIVTLSDGMYGLGVPSKSYNIMAAGKPILFIGDPDSEIGKVVAENRIGYCFSPSERENLVVFLQNITMETLLEFQQQGRSARMLAEQKYSKKIILDKFMTMV